MTFAQNSTQSIEIPLWRCHSKLFRIPIFRYPCYNYGNNMSLRRKIMMKKTPYSVDDQNGTLNRRLTTPWQLGEGETPWNVYPRPQLKRDSFLCLNGKWDLRCENGKKTEDLGQILVPFPVEAPLSGVERAVGPDDTLVYERTFTLPEGFDRGRLLLHFGAVDQIAEVAVNGKTVGGHKGGYTPFTLEVTEAVEEGENTLTVRVQDPLDQNLPHGKQRADRGGMWYTPVSGIWQTVWMESVPKAYIKELRMTPWYDNCRIEIIGEGLDGVKKTLHIEDDKSGPVTVTFTENEYTYRPAHQHPWSPDDPYLYYFTLTAGDDRVESYMGMRSVTVGTPTAGMNANQALIHLNGSPLFASGVLDQGYFPDGIYTPATPEAYTNDILRMKELGFNTLRKHIKVEPDLFYYECDRLGMIVFQDIPSGGKYSFLRDTALPTLGLSGNAERTAKPAQEAAFTQTMEETVRKLYNYPSLIYWTVFNEGWGQHESKKRYEQLKALDATRVIDTASGWFETEATDCASEHVYFKDVRLSYRPDKAEILSEFGGYSWPEEGHLFNRKSSYGYRSFKTKKDYEDALAALYEEQILPEVPKGLNAAIYTQLSDVEDEINGLLTYDRQVMKVDPARLYAINRRAQAVKRLREQDTALAKEKVGEPGGILLLGDSITDMYHTEKWLSDLRVYNRGFSGSRSDEMADWIHRTLGLLDPEKIVILIGSNDIGHGFDNDHVLKSLEKVYAFIAEHAPNAKVFQVSVLPSNPVDKADMPMHEAFTSVRPNDKILSLNAVLEPFVIAHGATYLNFNPLFCDERGYLKEEYTLEGLHLVDKGYELYTKLLRQYID